jgi:hypothetical protein
MRAPNPGHENLMICIYPTPYTHTQRGELLRIWKISGQQAEHPVPQSSPLTADSTLLSPILWSIPGTPRLGHLLPPGYKRGACRVRGNLPGPEVTVLSTASSGSEVDDDHWLTSSSAHGLYTGNCKSLQLALLDLSCARDLAPFLEHMGESLTTKSQPSSSGEKVHLNPALQPYPNTENTSTGTL